MVNFLKILLTWKNTIESPTHVLKKLSQFLFWELIVVVLILWIDFCGIYCKKIYNYCILRTAFPEHVMTLKHLYWYSVLIKLTNTSTQYEPTFHQTQMFTTILQVIEKLTTWLYVPQNTEIPKLPLSIDQKWVKLGEFLGCK